MKITHILVWNALTKNQKPYIGVEILLNYDLPRINYDLPRINYDLPRINYDLPRPSPD
jgi:hypothetical protein